MPKPNQFRVKFGRKTGAFCGLHFKDGISRETVAGQHDWRFVRLRGVWGASRVDLTPAETEAPVGPVEAATSNHPTIEGAATTPHASAVAPAIPPAAEKPPRAEKQPKANGTKKAK